MKDAAGASWLRVSPACWIALVASAILLVPIQRGIDASRGAYAAFEDLAYVPPSGFLHSWCLGHEGLLADIYWTRVVQYFGRRRMNQVTRYELLGPMLRITTDLDPHLLIAYRFGSLFLAGKPPSGAGRPSEALALLRRGIVANPDYWRLWQDLGFIYYWDLKDYQHAARVFQAGSERPGAMFWMKAIAATIAAKGKDPQTSMSLWSEIYRDGETESIRRSAQEHLAALRAQMELAQLDALLARYREKEGRPARSLGQLVKAGWLPVLPKDPSGAPYTVGTDGRAALSSATRIDIGLLE